MEYLSLIAHSDTPPIAVGSIQVANWRDGDRWRFRYLLDGISRLVLPDPGKPGRADRLWQTTCFEAFVSLGGESYVEFNFSPSGAWAAYRFDSQRDGMSEEPTEIEVWLEGGEEWIAVEAAVKCDALAGRAALSVTAVIEETGDRKSYWALAHPSGSPDFHDRSCFLARLPE